MFHATFIETIGDMIDQQLPENYYAFSEKSLQIAVVDSLTDEIIHQIRTRPDTLIIQEYEQSPSLSAELSSTPTLTFPLLDTLTEETYLGSISIYQVDVKGIPGEPVTRIELLSPGNKPSGSHYQQYIRNRDYTLRSGVSLVELDWLHETPPILPNIPNYPDHAPNSYPYHIIVNNPHPNISDGKTQVYSFRVADPVPRIPLPLAKQDFIVVDFGEMYRTALGKRRGFSLLTNYAHEPPRINSYQQTDQNFIHQIMTQESSE
jgi:hypothetical protein